MSKNQSLFKRAFPGVAGIAMLAMAAQVANAQVIPPPLPILSNRDFPVNVTNDSPWFNPIRMSIIVGDSVTWTNRSQGTHTVTSLMQAVPQATELDTSSRDAGVNIGGAFDRRAFGPGQTFKVTFSNPGTFPYICFIHPYMAGNVTVGLPGVSVAAGPVPDVLQGVDSPLAGLPTANGFGPGIGEVCMTADFEKPNANLPSGVVHCLDVGLGNTTFQDLSLAAFDGNPSASLRTLAAADVGPSSPQLIGRQIGGRFEGIDNAHNTWFSKDGRKQWVTEWHGSNFWTIDRMTNTVSGSTPVFPGADVTHVMTTLPSENVGVLTLEGGPNGGLGFFDPATSAMTQIHTFSPLDHPHGPWISCSGAGNGGGIMIWPAPMSNRIGFTNLPGTPNGPVTDRTIQVVPGVYPVAVGARSDCTKSYTTNAVSGTITVSDILSGAPVHNIDLPICLQCSILGVSAPHTTVPVQIPVSPDNRYVMPAMAKAGQLAIIDANSDSVINVVDCGSGCHGANFGAKRGGGFYGYATMQYQDKVTVVDMNTAQKAGDIPLNIRSILTLQGLTPLGSPSTIAIASGKGGGMGVAAFPLPTPWHLGLDVKR